MNYKIKYNSSLSNIDKYELEWQNICILANEENMEQLCQIAVKGDLKVSPFRSICWSVLLGVLNSPSQTWPDIRSVDRSSYQNLKRKYCLNPHIIIDSNDDPLSQSKQSLWNQHFCDQELCSVIKQDVVRTFPGVDFFRKPQIQEMMTNILFCYARKFPQMCYRQGMHEILAPLIFVLHCDQQALAHIQELNPFVDPMLLDVLNPAYLEEDAFVLFSQIMREIESYYRINDVMPTSSGYFPMSPTTPMSPQEPAGIRTNTKMEVVDQLNYIKDKILAKEDLHLHNHLLKLDIPLSIFGIRWLRLLFGREFGLQDLLMLWDAIFGENDHLNLTNYIVVAMLIRIRDKLICSDYTTCLTYLMRYPSNIDVSMIIKHALHMKSPKIYERPPGAIIYISTPQVLQANKNKTDQKKYSTLPSNLRKNNSNVQRSAKDHYHKTGSPTTPTSNHQNVTKIRQDSARAAMNAAANSHQHIEFDPTIVNGYLEDDPELLKIELQDAYNIMVLSQTKLAQYLSVLRRHVRSGNSQDELHQSLDGIEEICSLLKPKFNTVFNAPIPVDPAFEANEEKSSIKRIQQPPTSLNIQRSYNYDLDCRRSSAAAIRYEIPDDKYSNFATRKLADRKEVEMLVFHKGYNYCGNIDSNDLPSIDPLMDRRNSE